MRKRAPRHTLREMNRALRNEHKIMPKYDPSPQLSAEETHRRLLAACAWWEMRRGPLDS